MDASGPPVERTPRSRRPGALCQPIELDLTLAICAYNAATRLPATLEAIGRMNVPAGLRYECLVIDNRSTDGTAALAQEMGRRLNIPMRVIHEPRTGVAYARRRSVQEARGRFVSFVDDDNHLSADWVRNCLSFFDRHPRAGVVGCRIDPVFEDPASRPADFDAKFATALAVRDLGSERQLILPADDPPCGAGMTGPTALFRQIMLDIGCQLSGRRGKKLTSGEDSEIGLLVLKLGWEAWYTPALRMDHVLPPSRLTVAYLDNLIAGGAQASAWLDYLRGKEPRRSRFGYFRLCAYWHVLAAKMTLMSWIKPKSHPYSHRFGFWAALYRGQAVGYWELAIADPAPRLDAALLRRQSASPRNNRYQTMPAMSRANGPWIA